MKKNEKVMGTWTLTRRMLPYFKKYVPTLVIDLLCALLTTICELIFPLIARHITNAALYDMASLTVKSVFAFGFGYLGLRVIDTIANYYMANIGHVMGARIETDMRRDLFDHLEKMSFSFYANTKIGQLMARITSDLFDITEFAHHCPEEFFIAAVKIIGSFTILSFIDIKLTLIIFAVLPVMLFFAMFFKRRMRATFKKSRHQIGEINAQVEDSLLGMRVVQSFTSEDIEREKFAEGNSLFLKIKKLQYRYMAGFQSTTRFFDGLMYIFVVVAGALFMMKGKIQTADFVAYILYVSTLLTSIRRIVEFAEQFQRGMTGIERFLEVMDVPVDIKDKSNAKELTDVKGEITFEHVGFSYPDDEKTPVLTDINVKIKKGESVAIVGSSGSGKTTLCNLIPRFYNVTEGRILIDGADIADVTLKSLRSNIGVVQQDVYLFSGTIFENISYGSPNASMEQVIEAAKEAGAHEFISSLPEGYNTYVGERGVKLSGGQKQRVSIARVFLKNPPILILDEATSALDNESEKIVQESLEKLAVGRTVLTIAHRLTTIKNADTILVLTENGIDESGTHKELLEKGGIYAHLYGMYTEL